MEGIDLTAFLFARHDLSHLVAELPASPCVLFAPGRMMDWDAAANHDEIGRLATSVAIRSADEFAKDHEITRYPRETNPRRRLPHRSGTHLTSTTSTWFG
jgi:hypothetical protein